MDKSFLEKQIDNKAKARFHKDMSEFVDYIHRHPIGNKLKIKIGEKEIPLANFGANYGVMNQDSRNDYSGSSEVINIKEAKEKVIKKYKQEETEIVLNKLDNLSYLFEEGGY